MKRILVVVAIAFSVTTLSAQTHNETLQTQALSLKEWWRADNKSLGENGMTWLDNFYHGQGALVISTTNGVKTWLLKQTLDTVDVFSWFGGDGRIKIGDFNGDGITDYIDGLGNVYTGVKNGEPPASTPIHVLPPDLVGDFNHDGYDDIFSFNDNGSHVLDIGFVHFGSPIITSERIDTLRRLAPFDTTWRPTCIYQTDQHDLRLVCRLGRYDIASDGYALYDVKFEKASALPIVSLLSEYKVPIDPSKWFALGICSIEQVNGKVTLIAIERVEGSYSKNSIAVYDLTKSTIENKYNVRMDGAGNVFILKHSIENASVPNISIFRALNNGTIITQDIYRGDFSEGMSFIASCASAYASENMTSIVSFLDKSRDSLVGFASCGQQLLRFYKGSSNPVSVPDDNGHVSNPNMQLLFKHPVHVGDLLAIRYFTSTIGQVHYTIYDITGKSLGGRDLAPTQIGWNEAYIQTGDLKLTPGHWIVGVVGSNFEYKFSFILE